MMGTHCPLTIRTLSQQKRSLNFMAIASNGQPTYFPIPQQSYDMCVSIVTAAQLAWVQMVTQFAAENIAMGITQAGKTSLIGNALQQVNTYGSVGSLWEAYAALSYVIITPEMAPFITADRINWMRNQLIQAIGNLP
jgi:hypothetical protein